MTTNQVSRAAWSPRCCFTLLLRQRRYIALQHLYERDERAHTTRKPQRSNVLFNFVNDIIRIVFASLCRQEQMERRLIKAFKNAAKHQYT